ncbi:OmpA family protein [Candidatus Saccharibacteria bacterium]|nr:OmpA family protein [Candidatus Saccharibacteria bacterium]
MSKKFMIVVCGLSLLLVFSCVSKSKYVELENQANATREQLEQENKRLSNQVAQLERDLDKERTTVEVQKKEISELDEQRQEIERNLKAQIANKEVRIQEIEGKLMVTFVDKILFDSGSVKIKPEGQEVILRLAESFQDNQDQMIIVQGHTDDVKIGGALLDRFPTNWELSAARATAVVRFLQEKGEISPERLTASGFSYYKPVASNETEEGRKQNRRIEIMLVPVR